MSDVWIDPVLVLSTSHLPPRYGQQTHEDSDGHPLDPFDLHDPGATVDALHHGWLMYVPEDPAAWAEADGGERLVTAEVLAVQQFARAHGCAWVRLDCYGPVVDELPTWEW